MLEIDSSENRLSGLFTPNCTGQESDRFPIPRIPAPGYAPDSQVASDMLHSKTSIDVPND